MGGNLSQVMRKIVTTYFAVVLLISLGSFGFSAILNAQELRDPMQPPPFALQKFRQAKWANQTKNPVPVKAKPKQAPMRLTEIIYSKERKVAIIDDQLLVVGDRIRGARLVEVTRDSARLVRKGKVVTLSLNNDLSAIRKKAVESDL